MRTGRWWDSSKSGDDKTEYDPHQANNASILVIFDEALDSSTVHKTDFHVDGQTASERRGVRRAQRTTYSSKFHLWPRTAQPEIEIKGVIRDLAGNHVRSGDDER